MNDKKHIDRLFQEKLRNFEATPSNSVWNNISPELETKKKKRKIIPLWFKISGITAGLLLLVTIGNGVINNDDNTPNGDIIVNTPSSNETEQTNQNAEVNTNKAKELQNTTKAINSNVVIIKTNKTSIASSSNKTTVNKRKNSTSLVKNNDSKTNINSYNSASVATTNNVDTEKVDSSQKDKEDTLFNIENKELLKENTTISSDNAIAKTSNEDLNHLDKLTLQNVIDSTKIAETSEGKLSINKELAAVEELKENDNTKDQKTKPENRWSINPNVAPVYFNSLGKGSSIHSQFNSNSKSGDINMSYGIKGAYALNNKLNVRAGINKVDLGYSTNNIYVYNNVLPTTITEKPIKTIKFTESAQNMVFISGNDLSFSQIPSVLSNQIQGSIDQKLGFIEVPLELEYKLSQRKMRVSVVGGVSALFLNKNEVFSTLQGQSTYIGKATNINNTSFSANLGIGIDFKLSKKFNFNLEPTFKYQLNTFNDTSGNFNPYFIGLYSGFSFKF